MTSRRTGSPVDQPKRTKRRNFLKTATLATAAAATASSLPKPALSQNLKKWRMATVWPKNFPGLSTGAKILAEFIGAASGGRLTVEVFGGGEMIPPLDTMEAVAEGTLEMGHSAPHYWKNKVPAAQFLGSLPFGLNVLEQNAWLQFGGGQKIADKIYEQLGCKFFASGNTGVQAGGWFNKDIKSMEDYKGLKIRIPGLGGEVIRAAGGDVLNLRDGEISPQLQSGAIDATEWIGPYNDLAFGLYKSAKYYYYPGWHKPAAMLDNFINLKAWNELDGELQAIVAAANAYTNAYVLNEYVANNSRALATLRTQHKITLKKFPDPVLNGLGVLAGQVITDLAAQDPQSRELIDSIIKFRSKAIALAAVSEQAFYNARSLPFTYVR